jgi:uncharacterized protein
VNISDPTLQTASNRLVSAGGALTLVWSDEFNVAQLLQSPIGTTRQYEVEEVLPAVDEYELEEPVRGSVKLTRTNRGIYAEARLGTTVRMECSRCLGTVDFPVEVRIREEFFPTVDVITGRAVAVDEQDEEIGRIDEHHDLSLDDSFRQYVLLDLPIQPLCRPDCAGLCPKCGKNLNEGPCDCVIEPPDEPEAPLAKLLKRVTPGLDSESSVDGRDDEQTSR